MGWEVEMEEIVLEGFEGVKIFEGNEGERESD